MRRTLAHPKFGPLARAEQPSKGELRSLDSAAGVVGGRRANAGAQAVQEFEAASTEQEGPRRPERAGTKTAGLQSVSIRRGAPPDHHACHPENLPQNPPCLKAGEVDPNTGITLVDDETTTGPTGCYEP